MRQKLALAVALVLGICLAGCHSAPPYTVLSRHVGPMQTVLQVEVPQHSTMQQIRQWTQQIKASETLAPSLLISFYDGPAEECNLVASYEGDTLYDMKQRQHTG